MKWTNDDIIDSGCGSGNLDAKPKVKALSLFSHHQNTRMQAAGDKKAEVKMRQIIA